MSAVSTIPPRAAALQRRELERTDFEVAEAVLARDLIYACQGIDSKYLHYNAAANQNLGGYEVDSRAGIPSVDRQALLVLSEVGWLFRQIQAHASSCSGSGVAGGSIRQSFCAALQGELAEFYHLMAVLQEQSLKEGPKPDAVAAGQTSFEGYLTLRRLVVWLAEPMIRMRGLAGIADAVTDVEGGALINAVHALAQHGDTLVQHFVSRTLQQMCQPLFQMTREWVFDGRLDSAGSEFFITATGASDDLWRSGYRLNEDMRPAFISRKLACTILRAGKSLNFLRQCSSEGEWSNGKERSAMLAAAHTPSYQQMAPWEHAITDAAAAIDKHLLATIFTKYSFVKHCDALKRYLLLGQGDFIQTLMDLIGSDLNRKAVEMSEYQLNGSLDAAIRASNAQFDEADILDRLRVKLSKGTSLESGWDVFSLWYDMKEPLSSVINAEAMSAYLRLFGLLWSLKRAEHTLNRVWQVMAAIQRQLNVIQGLKSEYGLHCPGVEAVWLQLRHCHVLRNEMAHFCTDLQTYIMFEVLETAWETFMTQLQTQYTKLVIGTQECNNPKLRLSLKRKASARQHELVDRGGAEPSLAALNHGLKFCSWCLQAAADLDSVIAAHSQYLNTMLSKALLDAVVGGGQKSTSQNGLQGHLRVILRQMLDLMGPVLRLNEAVEMAATELRGRVDLIKVRQSRSEWGINEQDPDVRGVPKDTLEDLYGLLQSSSRDFRHQQQDFVHLLATQAHVDLKYLMFRLDTADAV